MWRALGRATIAEARAFDEIPLRELRDWRNVCCAVHRPQRLSSGQPPSSGIEGYSWWSWPFLQQD